MSPHIETLLLPHSQYRVQWREDGYWRALPPDEWEQVEWIDREDPLSWNPWVGTQWEGGLIPAADLTSQDLVGAFGVMPADGSQVTVAFADGTPVPLLHVGKMWACEWWPATQRGVSVTWGGEVLPVDLPRAPRS